MEVKNVGRHVLNILFADDDPDDRILLKEALTDAGFSQFNLNFVENGEDLINYLYGRIPFAGLNNSRLPDLILLDLNMPKKDGREALKEIKSHPSLKKIPVIVFTTSTSSIDIAASYDAGANTYISKALSFAELVATMKSIKTYWTENALV